MKMEEKFGLKVELSESQRKRKAELLSTPVEAVDLTKVHGISELVKAYGESSIQARNIGMCAEVYENMLLDKVRPTILLGVAGPLIAGGLRKVLRDMIEFGIVDAVVSTGAILYQDLYQARGYKHYKGNPEADDAELRDLLIDRIYDTYVDEEKFWECDTFIAKFAEKLEPRPYSSREFLYLLGKELKDENSILHTAAKHDIPVFSPALNDSSIGIGLTQYYHWRKMNGKKHMIIDTIRDNYELTQIVVKSKKTAAIYIAGGVPKNFINDAVVMAYIFNIDTGGHTYAFQLTTDAPHWGGLSGSTLKEATSWGKISKKATKATAYVEPTVSLPLVVGSVLQVEYWKDRKRLVFNWDDDMLKSIEIGGPVNPKG
ncbi:MAG: deoxyhypusine synthase [Hadesarchaea archaeon CG08_land_8_20_14_0_20_51_8]|nr:MAG: deoxyhypusine synthase [Hadesarchaea archaeon CG08_land_8_20_14_0_20_51_8]